MTDTDILIIGAGASGMAAAAEAAETCPGVRVLILERSERPGRKILVTGNGRCNLSNESINLSDYNTGAEAFSAVMDRFGDDIRFFRRLGLVTRSDGEGRVYPYSGQAASVLDALRFRVAASGAETVCSAEVTGVYPEDGAFIVTTADGREFRSEKVIVAAGSPAGAHGSRNAELISSIAADGQAFRDFSPALVPLKIRGLPAQLKGVRVRAKASLRSSDGREDSETGEVQFGDGYVSGICILDLSRRYPGGDAELSLDLCPDMESEEISEVISEVIVSRPGSDASTVLSGLVPKTVGEVILKECCNDLFKRKTGSLTPEETESITRLIKRFGLKVAQKDGFRNAQVCSGGFRGINGETMESLSCTGLYFCGEIVDVDGRCGGFNLHWAWASGRAAGAAAAESLGKAGRT